MTKAANRVLDNEILEGLYGETHHPYEPRPQALTKGDLKVFNATFGKSPDPIHRVVSEGLDHLLADATPEVDLAVARCLGRKLTSGDDINELPVAPLMDRFEQRAAGDLTHYYKMALEFIAGALQSGKAVGRVAAAIATAIVYEHALERSDNPDSVRVGYSWTLMQCKMAYQESRKRDGGLSLYLQGLYFAASKDYDYGASCLSAAAGDMDAGTHLPIGPRYTAAYLRSWAIRLVHMAGVAEAEYLQSEEYLSDMAAEDGQSATAEIRTQARLVLV